VFFLLALSGGTDLLNILSSNNDVNNQWIGNVYTLLESSLLFLFFYFIFQSSILIYKRALFVLSVVFVAIWFTRNILFHKIQEFDSFSAGLETILIVIFCILYFFEKMRVPDSLFIYKSAAFWMVTSFLIYSSGTFFLLLYVNSLTATADMKLASRIYDYINSFSLILKNTFISIAFLIPESPISNQFNVKTTNYSFAHDDD